MSETERERVLIEASEEQRIAERTKITAKNVTPALPNADTEKSKNLNGLDGKDT